MTLNITLVGGPTAVIDIAGLRIVTDPTFDPPREYPHPVVTKLTKTAGPAFTPEQIAPVDVVLVSHEHEDNLDYSGREYLNTVPRVYTTNEVAKQFGDNVIGMNEYEVVQVPLPSGGDLTITAVPAHHGPDGVWQLIGPVIGFVLTGEGLPTVYVSGDNSSLEVIEQVQSKLGPIDVAILFVGGPSFEVLGDGAYITLSNEMTLEVAQRILPEATIVPVHEDSWAHLTQDAAGIRTLFEDAGLSSQIVVLEPGQSAEIPAPVK
ncbi:MBL fold metallo-hydrolase [Rhodococcus jostii]|uniref:MBL fold metallo-hydrolase n=1 Tax=Rhodococcus jostii TaxID=132919 RepID=UPI0036528304